MNLGVMAGRRVCTRIYSVGCSVHIGCIGRCWSCDENASVFSVFIPTGHTLLYLTLAPNLMINEVSLIVCGKKERGGEGY